MAGGQDPALRRPVFHILARGPTSCEYRELGFEVWGTLGNTLNCPGQTTREHASRDTNNDLSQSAVTRFDRYDKVSCGADRLRRVIHILEHFPPRAMSPEPGVQVCDSVGWAVDRRRRLIQMYEHVP